MWLTRFFGFFRFGCVPFANPVVDFFSLEFPKAPNFVCRHGSGIDSLAKLDQQAVVLRVVMIDSIAPLTLSPRSFLELLFAGLSHDPIADVIQIGVDHRHCKQRQ